MDKGQISGRLPDLCRVSWYQERPNPRDNREVLVCLTRTGLAAHEMIVAGALERNQRLLELLSKDDVTMLLGHIDRLTENRGPDA